MRLFGLNLFIDNGELTYHILADKIRLFLPGEMPNLSRLAACIESLFRKAGVGLG